MNKKNTSKLWKITQKAGDFLQEQLHENPNHQKEKTLCQLV